MRTTLRRYELLLPLQFNDGQPVPDAVIAATIIELEQRFGAVSAETQRIRGHWQHQGQSYRDELVRLFIDVADTDENATYFTEFKEQLKVRFQQLDIWMTTYLIEVI